MQHGSLASRWEEGRKGGDFWLIIEDIGGSQREVKISEVDS